MSVYAILFAQHQNVPPETYRLLKTSLQRFELLVARISFQQSRSRLGVETHAVPGDLRQARTKMEKTAGSSDVQGTAVGDERQPILHPNLYG